MKRRRIYFITYFVWFSAMCFAQSNEIDSLKKVIAGSRNDTSKVNSLLQLSKAYLSSFPESAMSLSKEALNLSEKLHYLQGKAFALKNIGMVYYNQTRYVETIDNWSQSYRYFDSINDKVNEALLLNNLGSVYMNQGNDSKALENYFQSLQIAEKKGDKHITAIAMGNIGTIYSNNDFTRDKALDYYLKALDISEELGDKNIMGGLLVNIGETYLKRNKNDSALYYFKESLQAYENTENVPYSLNDIGKTYTKKGNFSLAKEYHEKALTFAKKLDLQLDIVQSYLGLGDTYYKQGNYLQALSAYENARSAASDFNLKKELKDAYMGLVNTYAAKKDYSNAFSYQKLYSDIRDTLVNEDLAQKINNIQTYDIQKKEAQIDLLTKEQALQNLELKRQKFARNTLAASLLFVFLITFILYKLYRKVGRRTLQLRRSLEELKSTQAQLIQSEKMASLGLLTAGIGHEIQNPLNFVNNFSELNVDLLHELEDGPLKKLPDAEKLQAIEIIKDLAQNMSKINHHGKRADNIIKGMLQHSRKNTGQIEPTNINALADEYLRLSFHGLPPKDKSLDINIRTNYDDALGEININPQDFGRVLLNLFNNAFYSVIEKKKNLQPLTYDKEYEPFVSVNTKKLNDKMEIRVMDNGTGIPPKSLDKIFQPFFTTKPTGQGTGLGLSLSYDIINAHGGELKVDTKEGAFAEFIITLPLS